MTTPTLRTDAELVARFEERAKTDFLGFEITELLPYFSSFEAVKPLLKETATEEDFLKYKKPYTREALLKVMLDYMDFAWDKANNFRGISASRSISHYVTWTWLAGDTELSKDLEKNYEFYGKDLLVKICRHYGWDPERWDDHVRKNSEVE